MEQVNDKELLEKNFFDDWGESDGGFAAYYCYKCKDEQMNVDIFEKLVELDAKLGVTAAAQLYYCLKFTRRPEIIKVRILFKLKAVSNMMAPIMTKNLQKVNYTQSLRCSADKMPKKRLQDASLKYEKYPKCVKKPSKRPCRQECV